MYTALIVDDESIIRKGLQVIIDWAALGVDKLLTASSGEAACRILEKVRVDFLMTDICMVNMNGLELIEKINSKNTDMRIVVLTGYDSFEYARRCCKLDVHDFLLKPIDGEELKRVVQTQLTILEKQRKEEQKKRVEQRAEGLTDQYRQEQVCLQLLDQKLKNDEIRDFCKRQHCEWNVPVQAVVLLPMVETRQEWKEKYEYEYLMAKNICISLYDANGQGITFEDALGRIVVVMFGNSDFDEIDERVRGLQIILKEEVQWGIHLLIGSRVEGLRNLGVSYHDAISIMPEIKQEKPGIYTTPKSELRLKMFRETVDELQKTMEENIDNISVLLKAYDTYIRCTKSYNLSLSMMRRTLYRLLSSLYYEYRVERGEKKDNYINDLIDNLRNSNADEMELIGKDCIIYLFDERNNRENQMIFEAKQYIQEHLSEELTLSKFADKFFVTTVYFSRLFKRETGSGFNEYVVARRMERAKNLLSTTGMRSGEIAFLVGYKDVNYFSAAFKRNVGMTAKEFREKRRNG